MKEKFLILEIAPKSTTGVFATIDDDRNIKIEKIESQPNLKKFFSFVKAPVQNVKRTSWEGEHLFKSQRRVVAVADSRLATTIPIPLELPREQGNVRQKLTMTELENLLTQAMQRIFNGCRSEAARRLNIHEIDTILVSARAKDLKIDGKEVGSPVGFSGKVVTLLLEMVFTTRAIFEDLKQFFNAPEEFFFAEAAQVRLFALSQVRKLPVSLIVADENEARIFVLEKAKDQYTVLYREPLDWSFAPLFGGLMQSLGVSKRIAKDIYKKYIQDDLSETASRAFKKMIEPWAESFEQAIGRGKFKGFAYVDAPHRMSFNLPHRAAGVTFEAHPTREILSGLGFSADLDAIGEGNHRHLLYLLQAYFDRGGLSEINQKLRHRLHWLK